MTDTQGKYGFDVQIADPKGRYTDALVTSLAQHAFGSDRNWFWFTNTMAAQVLALPEQERGAAINRLYNQYLEAGQPAFERGQNAQRIFFSVTMTVAIIVAGIIFVPQLATALQPFFAQIGMLK